MAADLRSYPAAGETRIVRGMVLMLLSGIVGSATNGAIHHLTADLHPFVITFFRNLIAVGLLLPLTLRGGIASLRPKRPWLQVLRGLLQITSATLFVASLALTPLAKATAINFSAPLFAAVLAVFMLGEVIRIRRIVALVIGFTGTLIVFRPWEGQLDLGAALMLASAVLWAFGMIVIKILMRDESSLTTTILTSVTSMPFALIAAIVVWQTPTAVQFLWLLATGAAYAFSQVAFAQALKEADLTALMPLDFLKLIWAAMIGYVFFAEVPELATWIGGATIFISATYIAYRERMAHKRMLALGQRVAG